jgi:exopolysaccharide production protein ExoF
MSRNASFALFLLANLLASSACYAQYRLGPDDNLTVKVYEWPDISGDYRIGADGKLSFPLAGNIAAADLTVEQLAKTIEDMLLQQAKLKDAVSVAVQVKEYRPFYIAGDVQKPGAYSFRPGMTVLQAVSVAGGFFRFTDPGLLRLERDAIMHRGERRILIEKLTALLARSARLNAERDGSPEIAFPDDTTFDRKDARIQALMERETLLFKSRRDDLQRQSAALTDLRNLYTGEIQSLQAQIESEKRQGELIQQELDQLRALAQRGLTSNPRLFLVERTFVSIEGTQRNLQAVIMRSRQSIAQATQQADDLRVKFRERIDAETDKTDSEIRDARARIATADQLIMEASETAPLATARRLRNTGMEPKFKLSRRASDGSTQELSAESEDRIQPGDVIMVDSSLDESVSHTMLKDAPTR